MHTFDTFDTFDSVLVQISFLLEAYTKSANKNDEEKFVEDHFDILSLHLFRNWKFIIKIIHGWKTGV